MKTIDREQLKVKLERGDNVKLIMAMDQQAFDRVHIPGSLHFTNIFEAAEKLTPADEIVIYCSTKWCNASLNAYLKLHSRGFEKLYRYAGGLADWQEANYPLEGTMV